MYVNTFLHCHFCIQITTKHKVLYCSVYIFGCFHGNQCCVASCHYFYTWGVLQEVDEINTVRPYVCHMVKACIHQMAPLHVTLCLGSTSAYVKKSFNKQTDIMISHDPHSDIHANAQFRQIVTQVFPYLIMFIYEYKSICIGHMHHGSLIRIRIVLIEGKCWTNQGKRLDGVK